MSVGGDPVPGRLGRNLLRIVSLVAPRRPPQFPQPTRGLASVCPGVLAASGGPAPRLQSWSRRSPEHRKLEWGSRTGNASTLAWVRRYKVISPQRGCRQRAGESGWTVPWRGGVIWTSANHRRIRGAGQRRCLGNALLASVLRQRPLPLPRFRGPSRGVTSVPLGVSSHNLVASRLGVSYFSSLFLGPLLSNIYTGFLCQWLTFALLFIRLFLFFSLFPHSFISPSGLFFLRLDVCIAMSPAWAALIQGCFFLTWDYCVCVFF